MNESELLYVLECCNEQNDNDRHCSMCPLNKEPTCHTILCDYLIDYIMRNRSHVERLNADINHLQTVLDTVATSLNSL